MYICRTPLANRKKDPEISKENSSGENKKDMNTMMKLVNGNSV